MLGGTDRWRALAAHGDAWQVHGRLRAGAAELPGARVMASGLAHAQRNDADVHDVAGVDVDALRSWYGARGVPWGVRVPAGSAWPWGTHLFRERLALLHRAAARPAPAPPGLDLRPAGPADLDAVVAVDHAAFGGDRAATAVWCAPLLAAPEADVVIAHRAGVPVGTGYALRSDGWAGPAAYLAGLAGPVPELVDWLLRRAFEAGAEFAHTHPGDDGEAAVLARPGFREVAALDVFVDV